MKSSNYSSDESAAQQEALENDIKFINNKISQYNANYNSSSIRLDKDITKISIKKEEEVEHAKKEHKNFSMTISTMAFIPKEVLQKNGF